MYYFAYGSNMNLEQMAFRCPDASPVGPAALDGYKLTERQYADIDRDSGSVVHGVLWEVSDADLRSLDRYEGYPRFYIRYQVDVECNGETVQAIVYEMAEDAKRDRDGFRYSAGYRNTCSIGAASNNVLVNEFALM